MAAPATNIPIEHNQVTHWVRTTRSAARRAGIEAGRRGRSARGDGGGSQYTLLELVDAICEVTDDEREIVATVSHLLMSGQVRLCGNFRDEPVERIVAG